MIDKIDGNSWGSTVEFIYSGPAQRIDVGTAVHFGENYYWITVKNRAISEQIVPAKLSFLLQGTWDSLGWPGGRDISVQSCVALAGSRLPSNNTVVAKWSGDLQRDGNNQSTGVFLASSPVLVYRTADVPPVAQRGDITMKAIGFSFGETMWKAAVWDGINGVWIYNEEDWQWVVGPAGTDITFKNVPLGGATIDVWGWEMRRGITNYPAYATYYDTNIPMGDSRYLLYLSTGDLVKL